jgi:hypothetical protein
MTRTGKIARLPHAIRQRLNLRLHDGESGRELIRWLNSLPEVRAILQRDFGARPVSDQNLTEWKQGGYVDWLSHKERLDEVRELVANAADIAQATQGQMSDHLAAALAIRYTQALASWDGEETEVFRRTMQNLHHACRDICNLRRGDQAAARLALEQQWVEATRAQTGEEIVTHFQQWASIPQVREILLADSIEETQRRERITEIFGLAPDPP